MISRSVPEEHLMVNVGSLWRRQGARLAYEVPVCGHFLDIVAVQGEKSVIAIELKVRDWRRALRQAVVAQLAADEVYIALWHAYAERVDHALLASTGVGLITVSDLAAKILVAAQPSQITMAHLREAIMAWVKPPGDGGGNGRAALPSRPKARRALDAKIRATLPSSARRDLLSVTS